MQSRLLTLPAELRVQIWLYAIPDTVVFSKDNPHSCLPALVTTCHHALYEILPIFLLQTEFTFRINSTDGAFA